MRDRRFIEALGIRPGEMVSLVGGGGKTTLLFRLGKELADRGSKVVTTTTTRILEPDPSQAPYLWVCSKKEEIDASLDALLSRYRQVTLVSERLPEGKLKGLSPNVLEGLAVSRPEVTILIEADGSRQKPLKFPNATEPVVPKMTSLVVAVAGIDALGRELSGENVFRAEIAARLLNLSLGEIVTSERMAALLTHPQGILKETPPGARVVLFINKMDLSAVTKDGEDLIQSILTHSSSPVCRIVLGSAVAGVIERHVFV